MKLEHGEKEEIGRSIVRRLVRSFFLRSQSTSDEGRVRVARSGAFQRRRSFVRSLAPPPPMSRFQDQNLNEVLVRSRGSTRRTPSLPYLTRGGEILVDLLLFAALSLSLPPRPFLEDASVRPPAASLGRIQIAGSRPDIFIFSRTYKFDSTPFADYFSHDMNLNRLLFPSGL